jgi:hypothetical protein
VRDFGQIWYTYDYKIGINKYPGNAGEISKSAILITEVGRTYEESVVIKYLATVTTIYHNNLYLLHPLVHHALKV